MSHGCQAGTGWSMNDHAADHERGNPLVGFVKSAPQVRICEAEVVPWQGA
jgi:hypothetical protein